MKNEDPYLLKVHDLQRANCVGVEIKRKRDVRFIDEKTKRLISL
jgi:hypothetical protein